MHFLIAIIIAILSLNQFQMAQSTYNLQEFGKFKRSIYPIIKVALSDVKDEKDVSINFTKGNEPIHKTIAGNLLLFYGIDRGDNYELIKRNDIPSSISDSELDQIAIDNLNRELEGKIRFVNTRAYLKNEFLTCTM